ncbi:MAG: fructosamine kinase family protein [Methylococcales bacterium]|jgi:fructosamine-3-kinase|nr:fructosamine kinase family protein [Methylococcales bacterium]MBT7409521.1 fructosamine kinase family protein [Methylococcales bacterium]
MNWTKIDQAISQATSSKFTTTDSLSVGGGCINTAYKISNGKKSYFIKFNHVDKIDMFVAEQHGLQQIIDSQTINAPQPIVTGITQQNAYIILEYIKFSNGSCQTDLGKQLAKMHQQTQNKFGWHINNTIGSTEQINQWTDSWVTFWKQHRLGFQANLAKRNGYAKDLGQELDRLIEDCHLFFSNHQPEPSLLHGDLWGGNFSCDPSGNPIIFDPATYYGDRETDVAMTELFGGFNTTFYRSYQENHPLDSGYNTRKQLYNLYHILNHLNMFGGSYLAQAKQMTKSLLTEI